MLSLKKSIYPTLLSRFRDHCRTGGRKAVNDKMGTVSVVTGKQEETQLGPDTHTLRCPPQQPPGSVTASGRWHPNVSNWLLLARLELEFEPSCDPWLQVNMMITGPDYLIKHKSRYSRKCFVDVFILTEFPGGGITPSHTLNGDSA